MNAEEIVSKVLYRDALMLVIDKPAGLPVHPGPKGGETLTHHLDALRFGLPRRPEAAHRLDKDTSGCLILGRHPKALARLNDLFRRNEVDKVYWAVVEGGPTGRRGRDRPAARPQIPRSRLVDEGRPEGAAVADQVAGAGPEHGSALLPLVGRSWRWGCEQGTFRAWSLAPPPLAPPHKGEGNARLTLLELRPITGRTHQLRVHCAASGWPILGDTIYGTAPRFHGPGLHLHARRVTVPLYPKKPAITVEAPVPEHMRERVQACEGAA